MKLVKIGDSYYNFDHLVKIQSDPKRMTFIFLENVKAYSSPEEMEILLESLHSEITEIKAVNNF